MVSLAWRRQKGHWKLLNSMIASGASREPIAGRPAMSSLALAARLGFWRSRKIAISRARSAARSAAVKSSAATSSARTGGAAGVSAWQAAAARHNWPAAAVRVMAPRRIAPGDARHSFSPPRLKGRAAPLGKPRGGKTDRQRIPDGLFDRRQINHLRPPRANPCRGAAGTCQGIGYAYARVPDAAAACRGGDPAASRPDFTAGGRHRALPERDRTLIRTGKAIALAALTAAALAHGGPARSADRADVKEKWHTPFDLYLDPDEAYAMKRADPDGVVFVDVRDRAEIQYTGFTDAVDANIPLFFFDASDWAVKKDGRHGRYRRVYNEHFVEAVDRLVALKGLDRNAPLIVMCTSGSRAPVAAGELHDAGYTRVYTQYQGFEGIKAKTGPSAGRRVVNGWKNRGLPWSYDLPNDRMYFNFAVAGD